MKAGDGAETKTGLQVPQRGEPVVTEDLNFTVGRGVEVGLEILVVGGVDQLAKTEMAVVTAEEERGVIHEIVIGTEIGEGDVAHHRAVGQRMASTTATTTTTTTAIRVGRRVEHDHIRTRMPRMAVAAAPRLVGPGAHFRVARAITTAAVAVIGVGLAVGQDGKVARRGREADHLSSELAIITITAGGDVRIRKARDYKGSGPSLGHLHDLEVEVEVEVVEVRVASAAEARICRAPTLLRCRKTLWSNARR
jgi:hypothetical protein